MYNRAKLIDTRIYRIRELSESGEVKLFKVAGENQPVDIFTNMYKQFIDELQADFDLSDCGKLQWFLGCKVEHDIQAGTVRLSQEKYCNDVLKRFQMSDTNPVSTSMEPNSHLSADDCPPPDKRDPETVRNYQ